MIPRIREGDLIICRRTEILENGMLAICVNDKETLVKKIQKDGDSIILISTNPMYLPFLAADDFRVVGEVKGIISGEL